MLCKILKHFIYMTDLTKKVVILTECKCFFIFNLEFFLYISSVLWFGYFEYMVTMYVHKKTFVLLITSLLYLSKA